MGKSNITAFQSYLKNRGACTEGRRAAYGETAEDFWQECDRPAWLKWWLFFNNVKDDEYHHNALLREAGVENWSPDTHCYSYDSECVSKTICDQIRASFSMPEIPEVYFKGSSQCG